MKKFTIALGLMMLMSSQASYAAIDAEYMTSEQYMLNTGYSKYMTDMAQITTRDPYQPTDDIYPKKSPKRFFQMLWKKVDPVAFPDVNQNMHDIQLNNGFNDLN